jgi:hypothetical protein
MLVIGSDRRALMADVVVQFELAGDLQEERESDGEPC